MQKEETIHIRKKLGFWKALGLFVLLIILLLIAVWSSFLMIYKNQFERKVAQLKDDNQPISYADLAKIYPYKESKATDIFEQIDAIKENNIRHLEDKITKQIQKEGWDIVNVSLDFRSFPLLRKKYPEELKKLQEASQPLFDKIHDLRNVTYLEKIEFNSTSAPISKYNPPLGDIQDCTRRLALASIYANESGDDAKSLEYINDLLHLQDLLYDEPLLVACLVSNACHYILTSTIQVNNFDLQTPNIAAQIRPIIDKLLDEKKRTSKFSEAMKVDRVWFIELLNLPSRHNYWRNLTNVFPEWKDDSQTILLKPLIYRVAARKLDVYKWAITASYKKNLPAVKSVYSTISLKNDRFDEILTAWDFLDESTYERAFQFHFQSLAQTRLTALGLAIRLYQADHDKLPEKLDDLVGKYIPYIPEDPFDKSGSKIRYIRNAKKPRLYSLNTNMIDDGGKFNSNTPRSKWPDLVFFINPKDYPHKEPKWVDPKTKPKYPQKGQMGFGPFFRKQRKSQTTQPSEK